MRIGMLGGLEVWGDGPERHVVAGTRLSRLLILLALSPRRVVPIGRIVDAVWGDEPPEEPGNAVQALVSRLRRAVPGIAVVNRGGGYLLDIDAEATDVGRFDRLVAAAGRADGPDAAAETLREALGLWRGTALADAGDAGFALAPRARLDEARVAALLARVAADLRRGATGGLVAELEGLVVAYPLREPFVRLLMRALDAAGDRARALAVYGEARARLAEALGADPSPELSAEHLRILRGDPDPETGPAERRPPPENPERADTVPTNLRADISSFVGRDDDSARVGALIGAHRLVTLIGPGGAGKTRLAAHTARELLTDGADGVWMVEFAPVTDAADLVTTVLATLGVRDRALVRNPGGTALTDGVAPLERLVSALARRRALLVFDNCEHLVAPIAALAAEILGACPGLRLVTTSREPLGLTGEALYPVEPLPLPPAGAGLDGLDAYPSIRLFAERAAAVRPGFAVTGANAGDVVRIVRALDGMPLAIELAAARMRTMAPAQVAARLDDRFAVLTGGSRTALPRHQTLRAVVDWSWDLLSEPERVLWRRLAVFTGGATLEAASAMVGGDVLDTASALVDKSLLAVRDDGRYRMLETIRAYGQMRLHEAGEAATARDAHAAYFRALARVAREELHGPDQMEWITALSADHDNCNAAVRHAISSGDAGTAIDLAGSLGWYWWLRGHRREGSDLIAGALALVAADGREESPATDFGDPATREEMSARAVAYTVGALLIVDGDRQLTAADEWFRRGAAIVGRLGRPDVPILRMVEPLRQVFRTFQRPEEAELDPRLPVDDEDRWVAATARVMRAHVRLNYGREHAAAERDLRSALDLYRELGERWGTSFTLISLAGMAAWRGELAPAVADIEEAIASVVELGVWEDRIHFRTSLVRLLWELGDRARARAELARAEREAARLGVAESLAAVMILASDLARLGGDLVGADQLARRAEDHIDGRRVAPQFRAFVAGSRGYIAAERGDLSGAREHHLEAVRLAVSSVDAPVIAQTLVGLAEVALYGGDAELAATVLGAATAVRGTRDESYTDGRRVEASTRAALTPAAFEAAYARGESATATQIGALVGVPMPELTS